MYYKKHTTSVISIFRKCVIEDSAMINIENFTINVNATPSETDDLLKTQSPVAVRDELTNMLRTISEDPRFLRQTVVIPDECEQYGFVEGEFDLPSLLYFLADMLE